MDETNTAPTAQQLLLCVCVTISRRAGLFFFYLFTYLKKKKKWWKRGREVLTVFRAQIKSLMCSEEGIDTRRLICLHGFVSAGRLLHAHCAPLRAGIFKKRSFTPYFFFFFWTAADFGSYEMAHAGPSDSTLVPTAVTSAGNGSIYASGRTGKSCTLSEFSRFHFLPTVG